MPVMSLKARDLLCDWPEHNESLINADVLEKMELTRKIVKLALEIRAQEKIPIRQSLSDLVIKGANIDPDYIEIVKAELNVKNIVMMNNDSLSVGLNTEITPELKLEGICRDLIRRLNNYRKNLKLSYENRINLYINTKDPEINECLDIFRDKIINSVQADTIAKEIENNQEYEKIEIKNSIVKVFIELKKLFQKL